MTRAPKKIISITLSLLIAFYGTVAQSQPASAAVLGADFTVTVSDLQFILQQIRIAESHRAVEAVSPAVTPSINVLALGNPLVDPRSGNGATARTVNIANTTTRVLSPLLPEGLRQVDGRNNNLTGNGFSSWMGFGYITPTTLGKSAWGAADTSFPRLVGPVFRAGYETRTGDVTDAAPRLISNLISDQSEANPAARAAASCTLRSDNLPNPCSPSTTDNASLFVANRATNGVGAPYNGMFALFGQFFDHGLDLVGKSSSTAVKIPLAVSDPLYTTCVNLTNRGCVSEISMGRTVLGTDPATAGTNTTTPWIDQNQTYTSHPSHQVFLREYKCASELSSNIDPLKLCTSNDRPVATGKLLDGDIAGNIANWSEVKRQAANKLGIQLVDMDIHDVPLLLTDEYGRFLRSSTGFPQVVESFSGTTASVKVGNPAAPVTSGRGTGHAFLNDIAHFAAPAAGLLPTNGSHLTRGMPDAGYYDNALLDAHFITGDGRGNENIGLTAVHTIFHAEHNRLWSYLQTVINNASTGSTGLTATALADFKSAWRMSSITTINTNPEWNGERLFHASKLITEMEYQHLVFGEFARKVQPLIKPFVAYDPTIRPDISGEFAHAVYRYGHSQLNETVDRTSAGGTANDLQVPLLYAFLNPPEFNQPHSYPAGSTIGAQLTGRQAAGSIVRGMSRQTGNEIDEFVTGALRNSLLGLPLDLATLNIARGRDAGIPSLNSFRTTLKQQTGITSLSPYASWAEFGQGLRHPESLVNFVAAYGDAPALNLDPTDSRTYLEKRAAAQSVVDCYESNHAVDPSNPCVLFMLSNSGLNGVDMWTGGLAEKNTQAGTMLGSTFDYVFKKQLEKLQESDRFYYLGRLAGLNLTVQVETNFFSDIIMRNTDVTSITTDAFAVPTYTVDMASTPPSFIKVLSDGTWMYTGTGHVLWNGTDASNKILSDRGDDSIYGAGGNDWLRGGDGNDFVQGGEGNDVIEDSSGANILIGGNGNDYISGSGTDAYNGNAGDDFIFGGTFPVVGLAGIGNDWVHGGTDNDILSGDDGNDWIEGGEGADLIDGDVVGPAGVTLAFPGNDILIGDSGNDLLSGFDGADIYVPGDGTDLNTGGLGFDWVTYYNDGQVGGVNEDLSNFAPAPGLVLANLADQFQEIEGLSGSDGDDILSGSSITTLGGTASNGLSATDCALITGLTSLLPSTITNCVWNAGDIIIGGAGSDVITGRNGNDLIDGNAVLQTWISVPATWGITNEAPSYVTVPAGRSYVASMATIRDYVATHLIAADVMADLQIVRLVAQVPAVAGENDVAVYQAARANYTITVNANGTITVVDPRNGGAVTNDGTDTLRNIETLRFTDGDLLVSSLPPSAPVLALSGVVGGAGSLAVTWSAPLITGTATITSYTARAWTTVNRTGTPVGTCVTLNGTTLTCTIDSITGAAAHSGLLAGNYFVDVLATTTVNGTPSAAVGPVAALQAPATQIVVTTPASGAVSGRAFSTQPVIEIRNALGGVVTNSTATVTASVSTGATVVGTTTATAVAGIARFANFGISGTAATTYTITYSISVPSSISTTETVTPTANGAALNLAVGRPISGASSGVAATTQPIVNLTDANGAIITTDSTSVVTVTITGPGTPSVSGITTATAVSGVATFSGLIITGTAGATYTLRYSLSTGEFTTESVTLAGSTTPPIIALGAPGVAPSGVTVTGGTASATITWNAVAGATRYTAQVFSTPTSSRNVGQCSVRGNGGAATFSCTVTNLTRNFTFYVDIVARNSAGAISSQTRLPVTIL
jgi:Ca2+-binding RTX toxin-like protein